MIHLFPCWPFKSTWPPNRKMFSHTTKDRKLPSWAMEYVSLWNGDWARYTGNFIWLRKGNIEDVPQYLKSNHILIWTINWITNQPFTSFSSIMLVILYLYINSTSLKFKKNKTCQATHQHDYFSMLKNVIPWETRTVKSGSEVTADFISLM